LLTNTYPTDHIPAIVSIVYGYVYHSLLEAPLELEALGLNLHSPLVNPALGCNGKAAREVPTACASSPVGFRIAKFFTK